MSPIFKQGDDIVKIVTDTVINASAAEGFEIDRDIIAITESVIARAQEIMRKLMILGRR